MFRYAFLFLISYAVFAAGSINPDVTQENLKQTACEPNWSSTVRPPDTWTNRLKRSLLPPSGQMRNYELDHIVPISIGGAPKDPANLWLQPWVGHCNAKDKDIIEWQAHRDLCAGKISLEQAQAKFLNWECR